MVSGSLHPAGHESRPGDPGVGSGYAARNLIRTGFAGGNRQKRSAFSCARACATAGREFALRQIEALLAEGVDGIHLYALNRLEPIRAVEPLVRGKEEAKAEAGT